MIIKFKAEEKGQADHVSRVFAKLDHDKDQWFKAGLFMLSLLVILKKDHHDLCYLYTI